MCAQASLFVMRCGCVIPVNRSVVFMRDHSMGCQTSSTLSELGCNSKLDSVTQSRTYQLNSNQLLKLQGNIAWSGAGGRCNQFT